MQEKKPNCSAQFRPAVNSIWYSTQCTVLTFCVVKVQPSEDRAGVCAGWEIEKRGVCESEIFIFCGGKSVANGFKIQKSQCKECYLET